MNIKSYCFSMLKIEYIKIVKNSYTYPSLNMPIIFLQSCLHYVTATVAIEFDVHTELSTNGFALAQNFATIVEYLRKKYNYCFQLLRYTVHHIYLLLCSL